MTLPEPAPGQVIRYSFLWHAEAAAGALEAAKDRPCAIVVATQRADDDLLVVVAPITHSAASDPEAEIEIPPEVCAKLGLDGERQWLRVDEVNTFLWPGYDLRPIPGSGGAFVYGNLPVGLFEALKRGINRLRTARRIRSTSRD